MNIVLIDDEPAVRDTLGEHLEEEGHRVRTAGGGEAGLFLLEEEPADLVITDLKMPGISGLEVLRRVRERWPATEVVLITGYGTLDDAVEALRHGAYDFLLKPVRLAQL
ncbi:MAG: response regulator, partial [Candidatus Dadabacteria bacterium]